MKTYKLFVDQYCLATAFESVTPRMNALISRHTTAMLGEYEQCKATSRKRFEDLQAAEAKCKELELDLYHRNCSYQAMKQERDDIQLRLHAIDHAYNEQQKSSVLTDALTRANELMQLVIRQRQFIRTLYTSRNKKKAK